MPEEDIKGFKKYNGFNVIFHSRPGSDSMPNCRIQTRNCLLVSFCYLK